jgi:hypothetical protein
MDIFNCNDNEFEKALVQFDPNNIVKKNDNDKHGLSKEIWETNRALDAMNCLLSTANNQNGKCHLTNHSDNNQNRHLKDNITKRKIKPGIKNSKPSNNTINKYSNNTRNKPSNNTVTKTNRKINKNRNTINNPLYNENYIENLKEITQKVLSYQLVTDFYNYNKKVSCCKCKIITFHPVNLTSNINLCCTGFIQKYSGLKTNIGKNNYNNSKTDNSKSKAVFLQTLKEEINDDICKNSGNSVSSSGVSGNSSFINLIFKINNIISSNSLDSKSFYKWKKLSDMNYFEKDYWCLDKKDMPRNANKQKVNAYTFSIAYHPKKDIFNISINPCLLKLCNINNNNVCKIELYFPFQNYLFVDTAYQALSNLMLNNKTQYLENNNINGLINKWNYYCHQYNNILSVYKNMRENYRCNEELQKINI